MAASIAVVPAACKKDETRKEADKAAENVQEQREDIREESKDLRDDIKDQQEDVRDQAKSDTEMGREYNERTAKENTEDVQEQSKELRDETGELKTAEADFAVKRGNRVAHLRAVHGVIASQPMLINAISGVSRLTDKARADLAEKMQVFQMRVDEASNAIEALQTADAAGFEDRDDTAAKAMERLDDAREDAWEALDKGDRIEAS